MPEVPGSAAVGNATTQAPPAERRGAGFGLHSTNALLLVGGAVWCQRRRREQKQRSAAQAAEAAVRLAAPAEDWRFRLVRSVAEECQAERELRGLLKMKRNRFTCYDGFEPSGRMHIAQGVFKAINVNKCTAAGGTFVFWVADWFALMNDKMGGDLEKIKVVGKYLIEVWKATGMDMTRVKFLWSSEEINNNAEEYWLQALDIARRSTLARIKKCCQIMGRREDTLTAAQIMYPIMQATDVFFLKADICQLGLDQRKVNMLARDYCDWVGRKKPVILSHHMLYGLKAGQSKMSKSDPESAIFMEDSAEDVARKIRSAYCPRVREAAAQPAEDGEPQPLQDDLLNPCLDYLKHILFSREGFEFSVGDRRYAQFEAAKKAFVAGDISEAVLKDRLIEEINQLLEPVRQHFEMDPAARELLGKVLQWKKECLTTTSTPTRLQAVEPGSAPVFAVFAPRPQGTVQLAMVLEVLERLKLAPSGSRVVLWLEDWSSLTLGRLGGAAAGIKSFYDLLLFGLRSIAPELMGRVRVCWQGAMILSDPSVYWISAINAGRRCSVETVRRALPGGETLEYAAQVLACLMHVADVLSLTGGCGTTLCSGAYHASLHHLASQQCAAAGLQAPEVQVIAEHGLQLHAAGSRRGSSETQAHALLTDSEADLHRKMKKAFCEPGNTDFCPPLAWAVALLPFHGCLEVQRTPECGGEKVYTDAVAMREDFASGSLHPGDLKPALCAMLEGWLANTRAGLRSQGPLIEAQRILEACRKVQDLAA